MFESFRSNGALFIPRDLERTEHDDFVLNVQGRMFECDGAALTTVQVSTDGNEWEDHPAWKVKSLFS